MDPRSDISRTLVLEPEWPPDSLEGLLKKQTARPHPGVSDSAALEQNLRPWLSSTFPGDADAAGLRTLSTAAVDGSNVKGRLFRKKLHGSRLVVLGRSFMLALHLKPPRKAGS